MCASVLLFTIFILSFSFISSHFHTHVSFYQTVAINQDTLQKAINLFGNDPDRVHDWWRGLALDEYPWELEPQTICAEDDEKGSIDFEKLRDTKNENGSREQTREDAKLIDGETKVAQKVRHEDKDCTDKKRKGFVEKLLISLWFDERKRRSGIRKRKTRERGKEIGAKGVTSRSKESENDGIGLQPSALDLCINGKDEVVPEEDENQDIGNDDSKLSLGTTCLFSDRYRDEAHALLWTT